jgi:hypothetical protein
MLSSYCTGTIQPGYLLLARYAASPLGCSTLYLVCTIYVAQADVLNIAKTSCPKLFKDQLCTAKRRVLFLEPVTESTALSIQTFTNRGKVSLATGRCYFDDTYVNSNLM